MEYLSLRKVGEYHTKCPKEEEGLGFYIGV